MRLDWLRIPNYRDHLRNFEIDFDETQPTTVLIGRNGSGKSYLFEAIVEIFRELASGKPASFAYSMKYVCYDKAIEVHADPGKASQRLMISIDEKPISLAEFNKQKDFCLPAYIFAYYSGWNSRLEKQFEEQTRDYYNQILRNPDDDMPLRRFFFCRKDYSQLVLLAFFLAGDQNAQQLLRDYLGIEAFDSALFVMSTPWWANNKQSRRSEDETSDPRFWNASGAFRPFLDLIWNQSLAPIRNTETVLQDIPHPHKKTERLYLFIKNEEQLAALQRPYETPKLVFTNLESLFLCDLIDEVRVKVRKKDGNCVSFKQLSEGEQQLLTVLGLLRFTQDDESLYLLDEPDTHLNPVWTYDYLKLLQDNIQAEKGQLLLATHNPLMIGSLHKNQVRIITQQELATTAKEPEYDPIGMGVDGLLTSELYGLASVLAPEIVNKIEQRNQLFTLEQRTPEQDAELQALSEELAEVGILRSYLDPYEREFVNAMTRHQERERGSMTPEEFRERNDLADRVLEQVFEQLEE